MSTDNQELLYKGFPIVRNKNILYYGNMADEYVVMMQIQSFTKNGDTEVPDKILVQLLLTDPTVKVQERMVKKSEKKGLNEALDIASVWLQRSLKKDK